MRRIFSSLLLAALAAGCVRVGTPFATERVSNIRIGVTTRDQIREEFGDELVPGAALPLRQRQVLGDREPGEDLAVLRHIAHTAPDDAVPASAAAALPILPPVSVAPAGNRSPG